MFQALDITLKNLLGDTAEAGGAGLADTMHTHVSFETPDQSFRDQVKEQTLNLFFHEVSENRELRENAPVLVQSHGQAFLAPPPLRLNCRYLVTAWSPGMGEKKIQEEHALLGWALRILSRSPEIPSQYVAADLKSTTWELPLPTMAAQMESGKPAVDFWHALGIPPRAAFELVVTIAMPLTEPQSVSLVNSEALTMRLADEAPAEIQQSRVWRVVDDRDAPLVGATISIEGFPTTDAYGKPLMTDARGHFALRHPPSGRYNLNVTSKDGKKTGMLTMTFYDAADKRWNHQNFTLKLTNAGLQAVNPNPETFPKKP